MKNFEITYFYGPRDLYVVKPEVIKDIADAGFNLIPVVSDYVEVNKKTLDLCREFGLKALIRDGRVKSMMRTPGTDVEMLAKEVVEDYREYDDIIKGCYIVDEPDANAFEILGRINRAFHEAANEWQVYINLFPDYATPEMLKTNDYDDYLEKFMTLVKPDIISYDYYHFLMRDRSARDTEVGVVIDERERGIREAALGSKDREGFFGNMEAVWKKGKKYNTPIMLIILVTEHGLYRNLTKSEILWEVSHSLVYGVKRMSYFTYWLPEKDDFWWFDNALTDEEGRLQPHYYDVKSINERLINLGNELVSKTSTAVFHIDPEEKFGCAFEPHGGVQSITGGTSVIGFFDDGSFLITNKDFKNDVVLTVNILEGALEAFDDEAGIWNSADSDNRLNIEAGGARLVRIRK